VSQATELINGYSETSSREDNDFEFVSSGDFISMIEKEIGDSSKKIEFRKYIVWSIDPGDSIIIQDCENRISFLECKFLVPIYLSSCHYREVNFSDCEVLEVEADQAEFEVALVFERCLIHRYVALEYAKLGSLVISDSTINGHLPSEGIRDLRSGRKNRWLGVTERSGRDGSVSLYGKGMQVSNEADLTNSRFGGNAELINVRTGSYLRLNRSEFYGSVYCDQSIIGSSLSVQGVSIKGGGQFTAPLANIAGNLELDSLLIEQSQDRKKNYGSDEANSSVYCGGAKIGGSVFINDSDLSNQSISLSDCKIGAMLEIGSMQSRLFINKMFLNSTDVFRLSIVGGEFPEHLEVNGFTFRHLEASINNIQFNFLPLYIRRWNSDLTPVRAEFLVCEEFCRRAFNSDHQSAIFNVFANAIEGRGHFIEGRQLRIDGDRRRLRAVADVSTNMLIWYHLGSLIDYGHKPFKILRAATLWYLLATVVIWIFFRCDAFLAIRENMVRLGHCDPEVSGEQSAFFWRGKMLAWFQKVFFPSCGTEAVEDVRFSSVFFSLEQFVPLVDLGHDRIFRPDLSRTRGFILQIVLVIHAYAGWVFCSVFVAGLAGLFNR
jgi:hypothetical protein